MAKEKQKKRTYYEVENDRWNSGIKAGHSISVQRTIRYHGENADFGPFLTVPMKELEQRLKESAAEEKKVLDQLQETAKAWDEYGAQTLLLQKAIEYLKVPAVTHTSNEWKKQKDGSWEISNMVYEMTFSIVRFVDEWKLEWEVSYMAPGLQVSYRDWERTPRVRIGHESSKKYKTMDGAQRYIQMKFDQYSKFFEVISPPIPPEAKDMFCVNGQLLQGYTLARPEAKKKEITLSDLLDCLEDGDTPQQKPQPASEAPPTTPLENNPPTQAAAEPKKETTPKAKPPAHSAAKKKPTVKKKSAPAR